MRNIQLSKRASRRHWSWCLNARSMPTCTISSASAGLTREVAGEAAQPGQQLNELLAEVLGRLARSHRQYECRRVFLPCIVGHNLPCAAYCWEAWGFCCWRTPRRRSCACRPVPLMQRPLAALQPVRAAGQAEVSDALNPGRRLAAAALRRSSPGRLEADPRAIPPCATRLAYRSPEELPAAVGRAGFTVLRAVYSGRLA